MISVNYTGRMGNNMFQYCIGRIMAEKMGYALSAKPISGFDGTLEKIDGLRYDKPLIISADDIDTVTAVINDVLQRPTA